MRKNSGEAMTAALIGLAVGVLIAFFRAGNYAQVKANQTGEDVSLFTYFQEEPGEATIVVVSPAIVGAGVGWLVDEATDDGSSSQPSRGSSADVNITGENNVVNIRGDVRESNRSNTSY